MLAQEYHLSIEQENANLVSYLCEQTGLPKGELKAAIQKGALWHQKAGRKPTRLRRFNRELHIGEQLHLYYNPKVLASPVPQASLIADEGDYSIWYKPYGMLCQGSKWSDHCTINRYAESNLTPHRPAFIVHRLDRAATGLIVIAHTKKAASNLAQQFELRQTAKEYQIIVHGQLATPSSGITVNLALDNKQATSHFFAIDYNQQQDVTLVAVKIETGRKHQIRRHAAMLGYPVVGDRLHNQVDELNLQLCACRLSFICPMTGIQKDYRLPHDKMLKTHN